jgi:Transposase and inactivated derivatives
MAQRKEINFEGQNIYIGIDVHLKTWHITIITESGYKSKFSQPSSARALFEHLKKHYPNGNYQAVYESGFSGFATYYALAELGINCKVIHAADVPTTQYENVMKTDSVDSEKLAKGLKAGVLRGIYIPRKEILDDRSLIRLRKTIQNQLGGYKSRIKHLLHSNGVSYPDCFAPRGTHWSRRFMSWLREDVVLLSSSRNSLDMLLDQVESLRGNLLKATRKIRMLSKTERYATAYQNLLTMPGIGPITAMCLLTEIDDINRFQNERQFASYLGLIPVCHNSGEKVSNGEKTFRGNKQIGPMIVESSWVAVRRDKAMAVVYSEYCRRMEPQKGIIRIARKLSNRIFMVLKTGKQYRYDKCW